MRSSTTTLTLHDFTPYLLSITSNMISDDISAIYRARFGLRVPEWRLMTILGERGSATQRQLVQLTYMDKVTVNRATKALEERGLIAREPNVADGRSHHLALTEAGVSLYEQIVPAALAAKNRILEALSHEEEMQLRALLERLRDKVQQR